MAENAGIYYFIQLLLDFSLFDFREVAEENVVLCRTGIGRLTDLSASTTSIEKIILIHIHRHLAIDCFTLDPAKASPLNDSFI